jgi:hypothetical protein
VVKKKKSDKSVKFVVRGRVVHPDGSPASGVTVAAFDKDVAGENPLGEAAANAKGLYRIAYRGSQFRLSANERRGADVLVRVYDDQKKLLSQSKTIRNAPNDLELNVQLPTALLTVSGLVRTPRGTPAAGVIVVAFDRDLRREEELGEARTEKNGRYSIPYTAEQLSRAEKGSGDLVVRVFPAEGRRRRAPLLESQILFNASPDAEIDLQLPADVTESEFERHLAAIAPLLAGQAPSGRDLPLAAFTVQDIDFTAADTGIDRQHVAWLCKAFEHAARASSLEAPTHLQPDTAGRAPAALFYGWLREGLPEEWEPLIAQSVGLLRKTATTAISRGIIPAALEGMLESLLEMLPNPQRAELLTTAATVGLGTEALQSVLQHAAAIAEINNSLVFGLVEQGQLAKADAHRIGLGLAARSVVNGYEKALAAIVDARPTRFGDKPLERARDLAALDVQDIQRVLAEGDVEPPGGVTLESYATELAGRIAAAFPNDALLRRVTNLSEDLVEVIERDDSQLRELVNLHPGLALREVIDKARDAPAAAKAIRERVSWMNRVHELNPDVDLLAVDYLPESESLPQVRFDGVPEAARPLVIANLKAYQRLESAGAGRLKLLQGGYRSMTALAQSLPEEIAENTGLPLTEARAYHAQAEQRATETALTWFAFFDLERDAQLLAHRSLPGPPAYLKQLTGYTELFGSPNFCRCEHCQSVLGAAAYFVDLMYFVERHILEPSFKTHGGENHTMHLRSRRPDLWALKLTCDNTNKVVATLDLVNDLLEKFIVREKGFASVQQLYEVLAQVDHSIRLPFSLPLEQLAIWLSHLGVSRREIAAALLLSSSHARTRATIRLGMSRKQFDAVTSSRLAALTVADIRAAEQFYNVWLKSNLIFSTLPGQTETQDLGPIGVLSFTTAAGLERAAVIAALTTDFVQGTAAGAPPRIRLESGLGTAGAVQNDTELAMHSTSARLDRFERLVRLWRHVPWTVPELDYVIGRLGQGRLDETTLITLAQLLDVQDRLKAGVDELCALCDEVPTIALRDAQPLFARTFNAPPFTRPQDQWPRDDQLIDASAETRTRLVAALQISDPDLTLVLDGLNACLGRKPAGLPFVQGAWLNARNLSLLYRHARLAQMLKLAIGDLLKTLALTPSLAARAANERCIQSLSDLQAVLAVHAWRAASGFTLAEIEFITAATDVLPGYEGSDVLAARIADEVAAEKLLHLSLDLLTQIGLTEDESVALIEQNLLPAGANPPLLERVPGEDAYRIARSVRIEDIPARFRFDPQPRAEQIAAVARDVYRIVKRGGDTGFESKELLELGLAATEASALVDANLSSVATDGKPFELVPGSTTRYRRRPAIAETQAIEAFGSNPQDVAATKSILKFRARELVERHHAESVLAAKVSIAVKTAPEKTRALLYLANPSDPAERESLVDALQGGPLQILSTLLGRVTRYAILLRSAVYDSPTLQFLQTNRALLAFTDPPTAETVRRISRYAVLAAAPDSAYEPDALETDTEALQSVLKWTGSINTAIGDIARLAEIARALKSDVSQTNAVLSQIALAGGPDIAPRVDELAQLASALALVRRLGISAEVLKLTVAEDPAQLARGAQGVFSSIRAKYPDEKTFREKLEPFEDKLRSRNRDGLVEYLLNAPDGASTTWRRHFFDANDLYHQFLVDVMVEGCARTSKVVAAISTLQLYVHRVLMKLEQSNESPPLVVARFNDPQKPLEWAWRKNYQVWVANRKFYLYPENYIVPGLRDDKTPLFRELEDTLLQQQINEQNVLDAYAQYLRDFEEVAQLRIAGAYHDREGATDLLHLFGVTASEPPVHYYRTVRNIEAGKGAVYSPWEKVDLQIPVRKVAPIVYLGRLFIFWVETSTRSVNEFRDGTSLFTQYRHSVRTRFSQLRLDGRWTPAQALKVTDEQGGVSDLRIIDDRLTAPIMNLRHSSGATLSLDLATPWQKTLFDTLSKDSSWAITAAARQAHWDRRKRDHVEPLENYTPEGWHWERIYPNVEGAAGDARINLKFPARTKGVSAQREMVDLWSATAVRNPASGGEETFEGVPIVMPMADGARRLFQSYFRHDDQGLPFYFASESLNDETVFSGNGLISAEGPLVEVPPRSELQVLNGNTSSVILEPPGEALLFLFKQDGSGFELRNLGTSLSRRMGTELAINGLTGLLKTTFQESTEMKERPSAVSIISTTSDITPRGFSTAAQPADWTSDDHPLRPYFREVFFQIPFLIADHLHSQQKFSDAQRWYHFLYDPTASEAQVDEKKRPWRYREFRAVGIQTLRQALTDATALRAYRRDPFNPHAIARLRPGAYQKAIFMKYIDNLLDWGDSLFSQFTMESVNEATMLYVMAADILGPRPIELGPCGETAGSGSGKSYEDVAPLLRPSKPDEEPTTDFLIEELESFTLTTVGTAFLTPFIVARQAAATSQSQQPAMMMMRGVAGMPVGDDGFGLLGTPADPAGWSTVGAQTWKETSGTPMAELHLGNTLGEVETVALGGQASRLPLDGDPVGPPETGPIGDDLTPDHFGELGAPKGFERADYVPDVKYGLEHIPGRKFYTDEPVPRQPKLPELIRARLVFCIPENKELRGYWDRVEDRLNKIRNCMDIAGVRRRLELFAPEIDPRMLMRLRAAGLSLDDVMNATAGSVPPYRFQFLIDKARQHASLVQGFGTQLLSALEKRDGEELNRLRTVHEQNLSKLRSQMTQWEIDAAEDTLESLRRQRTAAEYRRDHFLNLSQTGLSAPEIIQQVTTRLSSTLANAEALGALASAIAGLVPNFGAPTAMTFGGVQLWSGLFGFKEFASALGVASRGVGELAGLEASQQRRNEDWLHQAELARKDLDQVAKQITAAEIRRDIAIESQKVHERSIEQVQEMFDFLRDRFTNFGRFTWLCAELQKLHRGAFNAALSMARLAEQACQFEHPDEAVQPALAGDYWDAGNAGLLAGDRLLLDLHNLERRYLETHYRTLEIEQSFSLARLAPEALAKLKRDSECSFEIPEWFFDLTYAGHYRRRIKSVRLTVPCVVGPHTNVGATLRLNGSYIRKEPKLDSRVSVPLRHITVIAASMGQNDAGMFEFNFRDERYMPFEGAGANSEWQLSLPKAVKPFDYGTISDVILRISYTAEENSDLRNDVEGAAGILSKLTDAGIPRVLSLRNDFPAAWNALLQGVAEVNLDVRDAHVPFFMSAFALQSTAFDVLVETLPGQNPVYPTIQFDSAATTGAGADAASGLYKLGSSSAVSFVRNHTLRIATLGSAAATIAAGEAPRLDGAKVKDIALRTVLKRSSPPPPTP